MRCIYCGCTDDRACMIPSDRAPIDRNWLAAWWEFDPSKYDLPLPREIPCWWMSLNPPVCSAPSCQERHYVARRAAAIRTDGDGALHIDLVQICRDAGVPPTRENQRMLEQAAIELARERWPDVQVEVQDDAEERAS